MSHIVKSFLRCVHFYEFVQDIEMYKTKRYIQTLLSYCDKHNRYTDNIYKRYYYIYGLSFGRINAFKITNALKANKPFQARPVNPGHEKAPEQGLFHA